MSINWKGDGRGNCCPPVGAIGREPTTVRLSTARNIANEFILSGYSTHSGAGSTLWVVIDWCRTYNVSHSVTTHYDRLGNVTGYYVEAIKSY